MFKVLRERWKASTPEFFKGIVKGGAAVGLFGLTCAPFVSSLPERIQPIPGYMIAVGLASAGVAKLAKEDDPELKQKVDKMMAGPQSNQAPTAQV